MKTSSLRALPSPLPLLSGPATALRVTGRSSRGALLEGTVPLENPQGWWTGAWRPAAMPASWFWCCSVLLWGLTLEETGLWGSEASLHRVCSYLLFKVKKRESLPSWDTPLPPIFLGTPPPQPGWLAIVTLAVGSGAEKRMETGEARRPSPFSPSSGFRSRLSPHTSPRSRVPTVWRHLCYFAFSTVSTFPDDSPLEMDVFITLEDKLTAIQAHGLFRYFSASHANACSDNRADQRMPSGLPGAVGGSPGQSSRSIWLEVRKSGCFPPLKSWVKRVTSQDTGKTQQEIFKCFPSITLLKSIYVPSPHLL